MHGEAAREATAFVADATLATQAMGVGQQAASAAPPEIDAHQHQHQPEALSSSGAHRREGALQWMLLSCARMPMEQTVHVSRWMDGLNKGRGGRGR